MLSVCLIELEGEWSAHELQKKRDNVSEEVVEAYSSVLFLTDVFCNRFEPELSVRAKYMRKVCD